MGINSYAMLALRTTLVFLALVSPISLASQECDVFLTRSNMEDFGYTIEVMELPGRDDDLLLVLFFYDRTYDGLDLVYSLLTISHGEAPITEVALDTSPSVVEFFLQPDMLATSVFQSLYTGPGRRISICAKDLSQFVLQEEQTEQTLVE